MLLKFVRQADKEVGRDRCERAGNDDGWRTVILGRNWVER